ncbi:WG repeat-containing protein [uncultured Eudoraea sp.]|uniref:WG repeat-containing protein n=1 Tax=uncultured Eudoraea sp. TaxID=1035614 RepID=UPI00260F5051|nr:WG repeat-containing protein [uncultured Eudoraea sp.]
MKKLFTICALIIVPLICFAQELTGIDEIAPFSEGLAAIRKGNEWGFINKEGQLVIEFRDDLVWNKLANTSINDVSGIRFPQFKNGRCMIKKIMEEEEIVTYGFINPEGKVIIEPEYLNLTEFNEGYAVGILVTKDFRGKNNFQLNIYDYKFSEVLLDTKGDIMLLINKRDGISMSKRRYELPELRAKFLSVKSLAVKLPSNKWELRKLEL